MEAQDFREYLNNINQLNTYQFKRLKKAIHKVESSDLIVFNLESNEEGIECPHCGSQKVWEWGKRTGLQRYRCKECKKTFNSLTGTPLAHLHKKAHWLNYCESLRNGDSVRKAASSIKINKNTAFHWRHRFLKNARKVKPISLNGIVEAEEKFCPRSFKGSKSLNRPPRKRGLKPTKIQFAVEQICISVFRDRNDNTIDQVTKHLNEATLHHALKRTMKPDSLLCSDNKDFYRKFIINNHIRHGCLNLSAGIHTIKEIVHIHNANAYHNQFSNWLLRFHGVATKYLPNYLAWFREMDEFEQKIKASTFLMRAKETTPYKIQPQFKT